MCYKILFVREGEYPQVFIPSGLTPYLSDIGIEKHPEHTSSHGYTKCTATHGTILYEINSETG